MTAITTLAIGWEDALLQAGVAGAVLLWMTLRLIPKLQDDAREKDQRHLEAMQQAQKAFIDHSTDARHDYLKTNEDARREFLAANENARKDYLAALREERESGRIA